MLSIHRWSKRLATFGVIAALLAGCGGVAPVEEPPAGEAATEGPTPEELRAQQAQQDFAAGLRAMKSGNQQLATDLFLAMTKAYPEYAGPWVNLGILYHRKGKNDEAEKAFTKALEISKDNPEVFNQLGVLYRDLGKFHMARNIYEEGLDLHPDYAPLQRNAGILYDLYLRQYKLAIRHYQAYLKLVPDDKEVETWLADLQQRLAR